MLDPAVGHLLQVLLNNAADASEAAGSARVVLTLAATHERLRGRIRDFGQGYDGDVAARSLFATTKPDGLGIGLALSHATIERLRGTLSLQRCADGGTEVAFEVPLA
jgi:two-component system sensor histidine kinase RegB